MKEELEVGNLYLKSITKNYAKFNQLFTAIWQSK